MAFEATAPVDDAARAIQRAYAEVRTAFGVGIALDAVCTGCTHRAAQHHLQEPPGVGPARTRCAAMCVCDGFCDAYHKPYPDLSALAVRTYREHGKWLPADGFGPGCVRAVRS